MIKYTSFDLKDSGGIYIDFNTSLIKTAEYSPELQEKLNKLQKLPDKNYVLVNAMGSGEYWGSNRNGDYFPDQALKDYYLTFEQLANAFKHHVNKDPNLGMGKVPVAVFNSNMHRVELILELDRQRAEDVLHRIEAGEYPAVSMGCKVPYDTCSICGHKSKTLDQYCDHLKYQMNSILPDGRKVYAINDHDIKFFDISFVRIPADRTAGVLAKLAHADTRIIPSAEIAIEVLKAANIKESAINKIIDGQVENMNSDPKLLIRDSQAPIPMEQLDKDFKQYSLLDMLSTMLGLRIAPSKTDFQKIVLSKLGIAKNYSTNADLMDLTEEPFIPEGLSLNNFKDEIAEKMAEWVPSMSLTKPHIMRRVLLKRAGLFNPNPAVTSEMPNTSIKNPVVPLLGMGALYIGYNSLMNDLGLAGNMEAQTKFEQFLMGKPWLIPIILGAAAAGTVAIQKSNLQKQGAMFNKGFLERTLVAVPASYLYAGAQENKVRQGQPISDFGNLVRKHPFLAGATGTIGLGKMYELVKHGPIRKVASTELDLVDRLWLGLSPDRFDIVYKDIVEDVN